MRHQFRRSKKILITTYFNFWYNIKLISVSFTKESLILRSVVRAPLMRTLSEFYFLLQFIISSLLSFVSFTCNFLQVGVTLNRLYSKFFLSPLVYLLHCPCCLHRRSPWQHCSRGPSSQSGIHSANSAVPWCTGRSRCTS